MPMYFSETLSLTEDALCPLTIYTAGRPGASCDVSLFSDLHGREKSDLRFPRFLS